MRKFILLPLFLVLGVLLVACSEKDGELTRVDVQKVIVERNSEDVVTIVDPEKLGMIKKSLGNVKWEPNVKADMAREEDLLVTLFHSYDENMPERLYDYRIWFEEKGTATIISNKETEGYGRLDRENTQDLENALLN